MGSVAAASINTVWPGFILCLLGLMKHEIQLKQQHMVQVQADALGLFIIHISSAPF